ncbi:MAG: hypothetical protein CMN77_08940 [Spirochaetaceae bacterium]|nr:hypothetical protein [Spirochaetaceae bacterium]|tara:strand:- start:45478 stop:45990 length:513 start_codon:yes stop_codon:yes gene_type:complete
MQKIQDSYWFFLALSVLAHGGILLIFFLTSASESFDRNVVQAVSGFSITGETNDEGTDNSSDASADSNSGTDSKDSSSGPQSEALFTQSIGRLKQSIPYPELAAHQDIQGTVSAFVRLEDGKLVEFRIEQSSGFSILDDQVKKSVSQWQWPPVTASRRFTVSFILDRPGN